MRVSTCLQRLAIALPMTGLAAALANAATPKACDLFTAKAATSLVGGPVNAPIAIGVVICGYNAQSGKDSATFSIAGPVPQGANLKNSVGASVGKGDTFEVIPGLGDQSAFVQRQGHETDLTVISGQKMLTIRVDKPVSPSLKPAMVEIMKQIIGKL